jgi:segregation and condensation protein B
MSTKPGRRSSIRELKPGTTKKRGEKLEAEAVGDVAAAKQPVVADATDEASAQDEASPGDDLPEVTGSDDVEAPLGATRDDALPDDGSDGEGASSEDDDSEPSAIEAAMLAELSEGVADNTEAFLEGLIEALLFSSDRPMPSKELARAAGIDRRRAEELVAALRRRYENSGLSIEEVAGGFVMRSSPRYASYIQKLLALRPVRLSRAQLETLAIVAYRQPVTKPEVDDIRGVDSGQVLKGLLERELLKILGKKDEPGRPMLYGTTTAFLELLNLQSLKDLPTLREFTELSEESRRKFAEETGEESPEAALGDLAAAPAAGEGDSALEPAPAAAEPEAPTATELEGEPGLEPALVDAAQETGAADGNGATEAEPKPSDGDDDEDAIDLDALADIEDEAADADERAPASSR